jgi:hypothetical protein
MRQNIFNPESARALRLADLLEAKRAAARPKDLDDIENLE